MTKHAIGDVVIANGWPAVILEANRSEKDLTPVMCAVFGWEIDYGSVYLKDITPSTYKEAYLKIADEDRREEFNKVVEKYRVEGEKKRAAAARRKAKKAVS